MPWKENNNNEPWGSPEDKSSNGSKKKSSNLNIDSIFVDFFSKIKKTFFNSPNNKKNFMFEITINGVKDPNSLIDTKKIQLIEATLNAEN